MRIPRRLVNPHRDADGPIGAPEQPCFRGSKRRNKRRKPREAECERQPATADCRTRASLKSTWIPTTLRAFSVCTVSFPKKVIAT